MSKDLLRGEREQFEISTEIQEIGEEKKVRQTRGRWRQDAVASLEKEERGLWAFLSVKAFWGGLQPSTRRGEL